MRNFIILLSSLIILFSSCKMNHKGVQITNPDAFTVAFYNVENLFDTVSAVGKQDQEFTPNSKKKWNTKRYFFKLKQLASVIDSIGEEYLPDVVAFEEVENRAVLEDLVKQEAISDANYQVIHYESPDFRGIDNALIYNPSSFKPLFHKAIPVNMPDSINRMGNHSVTSRDILYVKGLIYEKDTLHIFVNHWTSMYYGEKETVSHRKYCAMVAKHQIDSIIKVYPESNILLGGDLNEDVYAPAVTGIINPDTIGYDQPNNDRLYNLSHYLFTTKGQGTYNYRGEWGTLDHMMVSGSLLNKSNSLYTTTDDAHVFNSMMIMNKYNNRNGKGIRPNRTYGGNNYYGGFSDHLPVYVSFKTK